MTLAEVFETKLAADETIYRKAFIVLGAEGSGTYMLANAIEAADPDVFILRRSYPHAGEWPVFSDLLEECRFRSHYDIHVIFIMRDFYATAQSVLHRDPERKLINLYNNQSMAAAEIGNIIEPLSGIMAERLTYVTYEAFVGSEGFRRWLFEERLGLPFPEDFEVYDGNVKYYE
jgi:hypothetical protein